MPSPTGSRRWAAGVVLLLLAAVYIWLGRRPPPAGSGPAQDIASLGPAPAAPSNAAAGENPPAEPAPAPAPPAVAETPTPAAPVKPKPEVVFGFPTANENILGPTPENFFMFVDRYTPEGQIQVWQGGDYGFVRNPRQTAQGTVYTKFHEGIDIAPVSRDAKGEPLDDVHAIAEGTVAYVTGSSRTSNYGNYVVVLHHLGHSGVFYSLYAHLRSITPLAGTPVRRGDLIGKMGYTGDGIDRRRAHVHLEIGLVLSERYDQFDANSAMVNGHGNFHGNNLIGLNAGAFLTAHHANPELMPDQFLQQQEVYYKVIVPNRGHELELTARYPWLRQPGEAAASWEISFTGPGVPVAVAPSSQNAPFPSVIWVKPFAGSHTWNTRSMVGGSGNTGTLTTAGSRFMALVAGDF